MMVSASTRSAIRVKGETYSRARLPLLLGSCKPPLPPASKEAMVHVSQHRYQPPLTPLACDRCRSWGAVGKASKQGSKLNSAWDRRRYMCFFFLFSFLFRTSFYLRGLTVWRERQRNKLCPRVPGGVEPDPAQQNPGGPLGGVDLEINSGAGGSPRAVGPPVAVAGGGRGTPAWSIGTAFGSGNAVVLDLIDWSERYGLSCFEAGERNPLMIGRDCAVSQVLVHLATRVVDQVGGFEGDSPISRGSKFSGCSADPLHMPPFSPYPETGYTIAVR
ncbi:hypothetical protein LZ31DRAFT_214012 [Colletotrichum somersetense]|nr:hypothetical protein LZ31DRAFT_214012 [Colletotrichum somersetense]